MRDLMMALGSRGITSIALVHRHERSLRATSESIRIGRRDFQVLRTGTWLTLLFTPISPAFPWHLHRLIAKTEPAILHLHLPNPSAFWGLLMPSARRRPWVVHWHSDVISEAQGWPMRLMYVLYRPFERAVLRRAAAIVATSARYRDSSKPLRPFLAKCRVVPLGLDAGRFPAEAGAETGRRSLVVNARSTGLRVLAVGRLTYYKGFEHLIRAVAATNDVQLDLVGEGDRAESLLRLVESEGLQHRVTFHGAVDEGKLARLLAGCDCLCLPSIERTEAFGMVLLEAMCFGKATVVADVPGSGMGWIVEHGVTGLRVPPANPGALADAFEQLAADHAALHAMGCRGRERFASIFEINHAAQGIVDTYRAVLDGQNRIDEMDQSD